MSRRQIGTVTVCGIRVPLRREPNLRDTDGALLDGLFQGVQGQILIRADLSPTQERDAINHELQHALWMYSGAASFLAGVLKDGVSATDVEETIIRIMSPHIGGIGWVK